MTEQIANSVSTGSGSDAPAHTAHPVTELWVERTGTRSYTGRSSRGAEVLIGPGSRQGVFTPGELLKIALAACSGLSADFPLSRRLGDNFDATIRVSGAADRDGETYPELHEVFELDLSELDEAGRERLLAAVERAIDKVCTVGRTLQDGSKVNLTIDI
ncbi:MAG: OsmC family protein, partial [Aldersonia sp.]|nr:OsmC family protein [Aldersonia sp.]